MAPDDTGTFRVQPHNIEAEQALLGAILVNNDAYHRVGEFLRAEHFFEPVHARIFERCAETIGRGQLADPVTLKRLFEEDAALRELDGARYLSRARPGRGHDRQRRPSMAGSSTTSPSSAG